MKIVVVAFVARTGGALKILEGALEYAENGGSTDEWIFILSDQPVKGNRENVKIQRVARRYGGAFARLHAELCTVPRIIRGQDPDVVLSLQNTDHLGRGDRPLVIYMHQSLPFQTERSFSFLRREERGLAVRQHILGAVIRASVLRAQVTLVQTQWLVDYFRSAMPSVTTRKVGSPTNLSPSIGASHSDPVRGFLYPASAALYKDHKTLHEGIRILRSSGVSCPRVALTLERVQLEHAIGELTEEEASWYEFLGSISFSELEAHYATRILVFPSYIETLGLPLYEAQAFGHPIVAASTPFAREALEGYERVAFFMARDPKSLAGCLAAILRSDSSGHEGPEVMRDAPGHSSREGSHWEKVHDTLKSVTRRTNATSS